jgi:hypothetical protein
MNMFFRHFRQRMLKENRVSRYFLYAIGEIVLVVIGILIALQINNWNEGRKLAKVETALLEQLLEDAVADSAYFQTRKTLYTLQINTLINFRAFCEGRLDTAEAERTLPPIEVPFLRIHSNSYVMSNGPDAISGISDPRLKNRLRQYKLKYEHVELGTELVNNSLQNNTTAPMVEFNYNFPNADSVSISDLRIWCDEEEVIGYSTFQVKMESHALVRVEEMIEENEVFIVALRKALGKRE